MEEKEDKVVLAIESANTKVLEIVNNAVFLGWTKEFCKEEVRRLVKETKEELTKLGASDDLILNCQNSIMTTFMNAWDITISVLKENSKNDQIGAIASVLLNMESKAPKETTSKGLIVGIDEDKIGIGKGGINSLGASQRFVEYTYMVMNTLNEINERLADETMTLRGSDGRRLSVRNLAEIETRYKLISEDLNRNGVGVNDFVVASSHADASERCSWWQGKIYIVDLEVNSRPMGQYKGFKPQQDIVGYIDGKPYYSLLQACNNGFLSYNCQHRLIKYYTGVKPPESDFISVKKNRNLTAIQRNMENTVRKYKRRETLSNNKIVVFKKNPYTGEFQEFKERDYNIMMSKYWQERYSQFSDDNNLPQYRWRLRITNAERNVKQ